MNPYRKGKLTVLETITTNNQAFYTLTQLNVDTCATEELLSKLAVLESEVRMMSDIVSTHGSTYHLSDRLRGIRTSAFAIGTCVEAILALNAAYARVQVVTDISAGSGEAPTGLLPHTGCDHPDCQESHS